MASIVGWDVGGVNIKVARRVAGAPPRVKLQPFELQRAPDQLAAALAGTAEAVGTGSDDWHAVTMTAELSQLFRTKREGVDFVLRALEATVGGGRLRVFGTDGRFHSPAQARADPLRVAAANWMATAQLVAAKTPTCVLVDVGSTTTDIIPIVGGTVVAAGRTDPERLATGELVYTGTLRTPVEAVAQQVPLRGVSTGVSAEGFATMGDVHLWLGSLTPDQYTVPTPDGRPPTRPFAGERLARVVCGDPEMLSEAEIDEIARALAEAQVSCIAAAIRRARARHSDLDTALVAGLGDFIAVEACHRAGLVAGRLGDCLGDAVALVAPAAAVGALLARELAGTGS